MNIADSLIESIARNDVTLTLGTGWLIDIDRGGVWYSHETGKAIPFPLDSNEFNIALAIKTIGTVSSSKHPLAPLLRLIEQGVLRVDAAIEQSTSRFRWQNEYFSRFASPDLLVPDMNARLEEAHVTIIGVGGLGGVLAVLLAATGVGHLTLVDGDVVEESNLPRQFLFSESSIGQSKVEVIKNVISVHNRKTKVTCIREYIDGEASVLHVCKTASFLALCADQPRVKIRAWVSQVVLALRLPSIAMASSWIGPVMVPFLSPCYICQARSYRSRIADQRGFVNRALNEPLPARAAFGPGVAVTAGFMASAIIHHLTGTLEPVMRTQAFRVSMSGNLETHSYVRYRDCPSCGSAVE